MDHAFNWKDIAFYRYDANSGGEREIQRTMLELLNQLDGFDSRGDVKVILATNKIESLDPALLRPGRIDRKIEFPLPDIKTRRRIFQVCKQINKVLYWFPWQFAASNSWCTFICNVQFSNGLPQSWTLTFGLF